MKFKYQLFLVCSLLFTTIYATEFGRVKGCKSWLSVRKSPGGKSFSGLSCKKKDKFKILGKEGKWYKIRHKGQYGYVSSKFFKSVSKAPAKKVVKRKSKKPSNAKSKVGKVYKCKNYIRITEKADSSSTRLEKLRCRQNKTVQVIGEKGKFYKIKYDNKKGYAYVRKKFIDLSDAVDVVVHVPRTVDRTLTGANNQACQVYQDHSDTQSTPRDDNSKWPFISPTQGGDKVFASKYQSCAPLNNNYAVNSCTKSHTLMFNLAKTSKYPNKQNGCYDAVSKRVRVYHHQSKPNQKRNQSYIQYSQASPHGGIRIDNNNVMNMKNQLFDCSKFVSAAYAASGLKLSTDDTKRDFRKNTTDFHNLADSKNSCFSRVGGGIDDIIKSGDVVNKKGHVIMIDKVPDDPFKIKKLYLDMVTNGWSKSKALSKCDKISRYDIDLTITHSAMNSRGGDGISKLHLNSYISKMSNTIQLLASDACKHFINNGLESKTFKSKPYRHGGRGNHTNYIRHAGKTKAGCTFDKQPKVEGEECVSQCLEDYNDKRTNGISNKQC